MKFTLSIAAAAILASCSISVNSSDFEGNAWQKIKGNGNVITEERSITSDVNEIILSSSIDVRYTQGSPAKMVVEGEDNLVDKVVTEVSGNTLKVYKKRNTNMWTTKKLQVLVTTPNLVRAACTSSGDFYATNTLTGDKLTLKTSSSGDIKASVEVRDLELSCSSSGDQIIKGSAERLIAKTSSSGDIDADDLTAKHCKASSSSSGDVSVYATESIEARTSSSGDIFIYGNPEQRSSNSSSSGDITFKN